MQFTLVNSYLDVILKKDATINSSSFYKQNKVIQQHSVGFKDDMAGFFIIKKFG